MRQYVHFFSQYDFEQTFTPRETWDTTMKRKHRSRRRKLPFAFQLNEPNDRKRHEEYFGDYEIANQMRRLQEKISRKSNAPF